ncbi:hypothetical protein EON63_14920 [archaeon]|nr:MAG: hypothetical protein EON63_14920 [archaeon]
MIEPNLATMLCYITTDLDIDKSTLQDAVRKAVDKAFNRYGWYGMVWFEDGVCMVCDVCIICVFCVYGVGCV